MDFCDVIMKHKRKNKILFNKESRCLQPLLSSLDTKDQRVLIIFAFKLIEEINDALMKCSFFDERILRAIYLCKEWAKGNVKMPLAKKALLTVHSITKEIDNEIIIAYLHAIGQGLATVHVKTHALGIVFYQLTALVLEQGINNFKVTVNNQINRYFLLLEESQNDFCNNNYQWAHFLLENKL